MFELNDIRTVSLVGTGNVATHLARALLKAQVRLLDVYSPHRAHVVEFARAFGCNPVSSLQDLTTDVDLVLLCVPDDQVSKAGTALSTGRAIIAHTSGIVGLDRLKPVGTKTGVFYPVQTFSKKRAVNFSAVPMCIESHDPETFDKLTQLAYKISNNVVAISSSERELLHLTAVMVNNFTNVLYSMANDILNEHKLNFDLLLPLIQETAAKVAEMSPTEAQTGPARRNDSLTLTRHRELLNRFPHYQEIYDLITKHIIKTYHE
jgi:predicted short-subunit dehydrogenase-like oxidoreductase (DUF2520 family)